MKRIIWGVIIILVVLVVVYVVFNSSNDVTQGPWSGKITAVDRACDHDGVCKISVDGRWIITDLGGDPTPEMEATRGPRGKTLFPSGERTVFLSDDIGKEVEVFAGMDAEGNYTLYGDSAYYIRIINSES